MVHIKGADKPVPAQRLLAVARSMSSAGPCRPRWLDVTWKWTPSRASWIGRRAVADAWCASPGQRGSVRPGSSARQYDSRTAETSRCSPRFANPTPADIPFHAVARLLRVAVGVSGLDDEAARTQRAGPHSRMPAMRICCC